MCIKNADIFIVCSLRFKKNIGPVGNVLPALLKLTPQKYHYKENKATDNKSIGFIAQEAITSFPVFVNRVGEKEKFHTVNYAGFSVVAIKAIQEQQEIIDAQETESEK